MSEQILKEVLSLLDEVLSLDGRALAFAADTPLLGDLPELDSMAVIAVIQEIEAEAQVMTPMHRNVARKALNVSAGATLPK